MNPRRRAAYGAATVVRERGLQPCDDGSQSTLRVTVIGGREAETGTAPEEFLTVLIRGLDCAGALVDIRALGTGDFSCSPSLQEASVTGTATSSDGVTVTADVTWEGTGPLETTSNTTVFPGFTGRFRGTEREAVATGTVVVDGETLVSGTTTNASIETLEDTNVTTGGAPVMVTALSPIRRGRGRSGRLAGSWCA